MAGKYLEQQSQDSSDLRQYRLEVCFDGKVPCLGDVLQESRVLRILCPPLLAVQVLAENGALAGQIEVVGCIQDRVEEAFEYVQT